MKDELLVSGDMLGDKFVIEPRYVHRAERVYEQIAPNLVRKSVIAIGGPSGSGKSETAALLASHLIRQGKSAYVISCDNYAHRPPRENDKNRLEVFNTDGEAGLERYLGTQNEADFDRLARLVQSFRAGADTLSLRIMNCGEHRVENDAQTLMTSEIDYLFLEGTWSCKVEGTDIRVYLDTDFHQTLAHRKKRARDPLSPFGERVLTIEQRKLNQLKHQAHYVADIDGHVGEKVMCDWPYIDELGQPDSISA